MKILYLIRHGVPEFPDGKRMCIGTTDIPMGEAGLTQAEEMAKHLPPVTAVFSSPLSRCVQTAQAIGLPVQVVEDLREIHMGHWDGLSFDEIQDRWPELYAARGSDQTIPVPNAEDPGVALIRFTEALRHCIATAPGDLAVVTHGGITAGFLQKLTGTWLKPDYAQVIRLVWEQNQFHLQEEL